MKLICINYDTCGYWKQIKKLDVSKELICPECFNTLIIYDEKGEQGDSPEISLHKDISSRTRDK